MESEEEYEINIDLTIIKIHFNDQQFDFGVPSNSDDWDDDIYLNMIAKISDEFDINDFKIYEIDEDGDKFFIDDNDDLTECYAEKNDEMHIYIKVMCIISHDTYFKFDRILFELYFFILVKSIIHKYIFNRVTQIGKHYM